MYILSVQNLGPKYLYSTPQNIIIDLEGKQCNFISCQILFFCLTHNITYSILHFFCEEHIDIKINTETSTKHLTKNKNDNGIFEIPFVFNLQTMSSLTLSIVDGKSPNESRRPHLSNEEEGRTVDGPP